MRERVYRKKTYLLAINFNTLSASSSSIFKTLFNSLWLTHVFVSSFQIYRNPERDSNLGPKRMSLLEFETLRLRPISHHGRSFKTIINYIYFSKNYVSNCLIICHFLLKSNHMKRYKRIIYIVICLVKYAASQ